jgi:hypothetical protein
MADILATLIPAALSGLAVAIPVLRRMATSAEASKARHDALVLLLKGAPMTPEASQMVASLNAAADAVAAKVAADVSAVADGKAAGAAAESSEIVAALAPIVAKLQALVPPQ